MKRNTIDMAGAVPVEPRLVPGVGRWLMVQCPAGHLLRSVPWGEWTEARKRYEREGATEFCTRCGPGGAPSHGGRLS